MIYKKCWFCKTNILHIYSIKNTVYTTCNCVNKSFNVSIFKIYGLGKNKRYSELDWLLNQVRINVL